MIVLQGHQDEAVSASQAHFARGQNRVVVEMATGAGKSFTQAELLRLHGEEGPAAVFVPSEQLVGQNAEAYKTYAASRGDPEPFVVGVFSGEKSAAIDIQSTDPEDISEAMIAARQDGRRVVVVSTYASSGKVEMAQAMNGHVFGLLVTDEAHRMASGQAVESLGEWTKPLFDAHIPAKNRANFTATLRPDGDMEQESQALAMNNVDLFGPVAYSFGYAAARDRGVLAPVQPHIVALEAADIEAAMEEAGASRGEKESEGAFRARRRAFAASLMLPATVQRARADNGQASVMVLCPPGGGGAHAQTVARLGAGMLDGGMKVAAVHGKSTTGVQEVMEWGRQPGVESVVAVVDMLREGTDMPALNSLVVARPAQSHILLTQAVGRITRRHPKAWNLPEKTGHVMVPLIVDRRKGGEVVDGEIAANFVSSFLRLDSEALKSFQSAQLLDARAGTCTNPSKPDGCMHTAHSLGEMFDVDMRDPATARLLAHIAGEVAGRDSIGHTHHMMGRYLEYVAENDVSPQDRATLAPSRSRKVGAGHNQVAVWARSVTEAYAHGKLSREECALLEETQGFVFAHGWDKELVKGCIDQAVARHGMFPGKTSDKAGLFPGVESLEGVVKAMREEVFAHENTHQATQSHVLAVPESDRPQWRAQAKEWWNETLAQGKVPAWAPAFPGHVRMMEGVLDRDGQSGQWRLHQEKGGVAFSHPRGDEDLSDTARGVIDRLEEKRIFKPHMRGMGLRHAAMVGKDEGLLLPLAVHSSLDETLAPYQGRRITCSVLMEADAKGQAIQMRITPEAAARIGADTKESNRARRLERHASVSPEVFQLSGAVRRLHKEGWPPLGPDLLQQGFDPQRKMFAGSNATLGYMLDRLEDVRVRLCEGTLPPGDMYQMNNTPGFDWITPAHLMHKGASQISAPPHVPRKTFHDLASALMAAGGSRREPLDTFTRWGEEESFHDKNAFGRAHLMAYRVFGKERSLRRKVTQNVALSEGERAAYKQVRFVMQQAPELFEGFAKAADRDLDLHKARLGQMNTTISEAKRRRAQVLDQGSR